MVFSSINTSTIDQNIHCDYIKYTVANELSSFCKQSLFSKHWNGEVYVSLMKTDKLSY